jgi:hypothetical protein
MYKVAEEQITRRGLSPFARYSLGAVAAAFGVMMFAIAPANASFDVFGIFCLLISAACVTTGRVRQCLGSFIGVVLLVLSGWYLYTQLTAGPVVSSRHSDPSVLNAWLFFLGFGLPGAAYAVRVRFGWRR